jgi:hypothetical protein
MAQARLYKMITPPKFKGGGITVKVGDKVVTQPAAGFAKSISATNSLGASVNSIAIMVEEMKDSFAQYTFKNMELREEMLKQREDYIKDEKKRIKDAKRAAIRQAGLVRDRASEKLQEKKTDKEEDKQTIGAAKKALGFFEGVAALLKNLFKTLLIYTVLDWMSKPENREKLIKIFTAVKGMIEAFVKIADFLVTFGLEGLVEFLENPLSFGGLFGLLKFITVLGAIFAPVALAKFGLAAGGAIMKLVTGGGLKKMLTGLFSGIGGMIRGLMAFVKGMGLGGMLALGAGAIVVGTAIAAVNANQDGTAVIEDPDDPNKSQADEIRESGGMTGAPISADMLGFGEFARGGPLPQFAAGGWIHGPQSGYPVSLDGGRSTAFIGHGTEYVATKAAGGGVGKAFVVPFDTPATRGNPGLTNTRLAEASRSGFGLPMPFSKGGEVPQMFLGGMIDAGKNLLGLNKTMDPVLFGLAKKGVGMSVNMLGGNPDYWKKPESQRSIEDMAREVASKSQILKSGGQDKVHVVKEPTGKSTSGSGSDSKSTGPQKIDIAKVFQNLGGADLMGSYMNDMGEAANKAKGGFVKGCTWCNKKRMAAGGLLDFIASGEGGYNSMNQGTRNGRIVGSTHNASEILGKNLTDMTVGEVMSQQSSGKLFAAGRYQIIPSTMKYIVKEMNIDKEAKYDKSLQDKLGVGLIKYKRPYAWQYIQKQHNDESGAMLELAREWASLPDPATGESVYGNGNKALHSVAEVKQALNSARGGAALVSDDPNLNLASAQKPGQGGTSPDGTAADDGTGTVADAKPKKIDIMSAFNNLGGKDMLQSYFDDMDHEGSGSKISESALAEKEAAATKKQDSVQVGDLNPTAPPPVEPPPPVVAGGGSQYKNPAEDFLVARMGWLSDLSTPPKNLI